MKRRFSVLFTFLLSFVLVACGNGGSGEGTSNGGSESASGENTVNYIAEQELMTLDSTLLSDINSANFSGHIQEGLYWENENNEVQPALAADLPEISEDQLTYTITLRDDVQWENGTPITADDFVYALRRLVDPETAAGYAYLAETMVNAPEIMAGELEPTELGVEALDEKTIEIQLTAPTPHMMNLLAFPTFYPLNQAFVEEQGQAFGTNSDAVLASGPYTVEDWDGTGQTWRLAKNENYYNADQVAIDAINVQVIKEVSTSVNLFESGQADNAPLSGELAKQYAQHPNALIQETAGTYTINFNHENEALQNRDLREAIDYAINNQELVDNVLGDGSKASSSYIPADFIFNPETGADFVEDAGAEGKYDEAKATELWEQAKADLGVDSVTLGLLSSDTEGTKLVTEYIQGQIQNALPGVSVEIQNVPAKNRITMEGNGEYDMVVSGWIADYASGMNFLELMETDGAYNWSRYSNPAYDALIQASKTEDAGDAAATWENYLAAHDILVEDAAWVPLYQSVNAQLLSPRIENLTLRAVGNEFDFRTASIAE